jgi:predicted nucleic acid-binding protein
VRYLLDTNVLSEFYRPRPDPRVTGWFLRQSPGDLVVSTISVGEIEKGVHQLAIGRKRATLAQWLEEWVLDNFGDRAIPVDIAVSRTWGRVLAESIRSGRALAEADALLLATAALYELVLVTRNERHFRERGVDILNPWRR